MSTTTLTRAGVARSNAFSLCSGERLSNVHIARSVFGSASLPAILVLGGISAGRHLLPDSASPHSGWWPGVIGAGRALDPARFRLIGIDYLGGRGDSSCDDDLGAADAPLVSTEDHARLILGALDELGIDHIDAVVGASFGGMIGLALCAIAPERVGRAVIIAAADHSDPMATAGRSLQRRIVELGVATGAVDTALSIARGIAVTSYRSAREFRQRFSTGTSAADHDDSRDVASYLVHQGAKFSASFPGAGFLSLSRALDAHRVTPSSITTRVALIGFDSDCLVPTAQLTALAREIPSCTLTILPSRYGHDGFLKESAALNPVIRRFLQPRTNAVTSATRAVRAAVATDAQHGAVIPPLHLSTTFTFEEFGRARSYDYTRSGNPTRDQLGCALAELEGASQGVVTATGMSAVLLPLQLLQPGDLLLAPHDCYGGTHRLFTSLAGKGAFELGVVDFTGDHFCDVIRARRPRMVWIETPSNPLLRITDIRAVCSAAHSVGAIVVADNTFLSPALQQPLSLGADIVVHSTTKYINGHSDVVGGAVIARHNALHTELAWWGNCLGVTGSPFDAWLTLRGLRTLHVRIAAQQDSAAAIAHALLRSEHVRAVHYPGLATHPGHRLAERQQHGFGAMLSFELEGGVHAARAFTDGLASFSLAESLGGVESLVAHPATMTHASMSADVRLAAGITDGLLRLSIGLESIDDLLDDVVAGLERAAAVTAPLP